MKQRAESTGNRYTNQIEILTAVLKLGAMFVGSKRYSKKRSFHLLRTDQHVSVQILQNYVSSVQVPWLFF